MQVQTWTPLDFKIGLDPKAQRLFFLTQIKGLSCN